MTTGAMATYMNEVDSRMAGGGARHKAATGAALRTGDDGFKTLLEGEAAGQGARQADEPRSRAYRAADDRMAGMQTGRHAPNAEGEWSFWDFLDVINPLQHLPVISVIYRHLTGDEISGPARIIGDGLYGGPIGLASGVFNAAVEDATGRDIGGNIIAMVTGGDDPAPTETAVAAMTEELNKLEPAAGAPRAEITWKTERIETQHHTGLPQPPAPTPIANRTGDAGMTAQQAGAERPRADARGIPEGTLNTNSGDGPLQPSHAPVSHTGQGYVDSPGFLSLHEAPAEAGGTGDSPGLIAQKMMDALDQYGAMQRTRQTGM